MQIQFKGIILLICWKISWDRFIQIHFSNVREFDGVIAWERNLNAHVQQSFLMEMEQNWS